MTRTANGDLRLALYERIIFGLLAVGSTIAIGLSGWSLYTLVQHGERISRVEGRLDSRTP